MVLLWYQTDVWLSSPRAENFLFGAVNYALNLRETYVEFFRERLVAYAVYKPPAEDRAVSLRMDQVAYKRLNLAVRVLGKRILHFFAFTRPVPWHILHLR